MFFRPLIACVLVSICVSGAFADRIVQLPSGLSLLPKQLKFDYYKFSRYNDRSMAFITGTVAPFVELTGMFEERPGHKGVASLSGQYGVLQPFPDKTPGLAVGIYDAFDKTEIGRSIYGVITFQFNIWSDWAKRERAQFAIGYGSGGFRSGAFLAFEMPAFRNITLLGEYFNESITAGVEVGLGRKLGLRALVRDNVTIFGIQYRIGF